MATGFVHDVHCLIAFGFPYAHIHRRRDSAARSLPGPRHRQVRHGWYRAFGKAWTFENPFPTRIKDRIVRINAAAGGLRAEEYMVSLSHDYLDRTWDFEQLSRHERDFSRLYAEGFCVWLLLNPRLLKEWAGVDVLLRRVHRVIEGSEVWEDEPSLRAEYDRLLKRARFLLRVNPKLRELVEHCGASKTKAV